MSEKSETQCATLGGGCFWCLEAVFEQLKGVEEVICGYAGGTVPHPTYEQVCGKRTGHAEVVRLVFDPKVVSFEELLEVFFSIHDPTTPDCQGADVGPQYRSIVLYHTPEQKATAEKLITELEREETWGAPIVTEVVPAAAFYPAEPQHQKYFRRHPERGYCQVVIAPKVAKLRKHHLEKLRH